jgi:hypothetical protein
MFDVVVVRLRCASARQARINPMRTRTVCPIPPAMARVKRESENTRKTPDGNRLLGGFIFRNGVPAERRHFKQIGRAAVSAALIFDL